ncbi:helix-turn-helix domain-containing protein [Paenibacillus sp. GD4]|uniref:PucR family transcriptional regulator n=1 Tax=Paenibacillus sp. GD4 TaxID=3068890 RepID=UPI0027967C58|nr:helix-turn-helix domain-containing protein [Paenibacillus sp. GD4]MDQ1914345.1 helix-turn-helix domain-containing protein [Paenibacillus sp. GD4]
MKQIDAFDRPFDSFDTLADRIGEALRCPVTIENANHQLIAYSSHKVPADPARTATIISRRVPEQVVSSLWKNGILRMLMDSDQPVRVPAISDVGLGDRVVVAIRHHNEVLGYIWALEDEERLDEQGLMTLRQAARASRDLMLQLQLQRSKEEAGKQNLFWQLLTGNRMTADEIKRKAAELGIDLPRAYQVIVLQFGSDIVLNEYRQIQYMLTAAAGMSVKLQVRDARHLIVLAGTPSGQPDNKASGAFVRSFIRQWSERMGGAAVDGAGGLFYDDYTLVERSYREALQVLSLKRDFPQALSDAVSYGALGFYRFLPLMDQAGNAAMEEPGVIHKLLKYDQEHGSCLLQTLRVYLEQDSHVKDTADALHIHTNTLTYRLKRIAEVGGIDLNSMDQKVDVYLQLKLMTITRSVC